MKKVIIALAAVLGLAFVAPATVRGAGGNRRHQARPRPRPSLRLAPSRPRHHYGWRHRDHRANKVVIIKKQRHSHM